MAVDLLPMVLMLILLMASLIFANLNMLRVWRLRQQGDNGKDQLIRALENQVGAQENLIAKLNELVTEKDKTAKVYEKETIAELMHRSPR